MHRKLWRSNVNYFNTCFSSYHWSNSWTTKTILLNDEVLKWNRWSSICCKYSKNGSTYWICHISLICVNFDDCTLVNLRLVLRLMLLSVVWMNCMSHVSRNDKAIPDYSIVVLLGQICFKVIRDSFCGFNNQIAVSSCSWLGSDFFMIK